MLMSPPLSASLANSGLALWLAICRSELCPLKREQQVRLRNILATSEGILQKLAPLLRTEAAGYETEMGLSQRICRPAG